MFKMKSFGPFTGFGGATQASKMVRVFSVLTESLLNTKLLIGMLRSRLD